MTKTKLVRRYKHKEEGPCACQTCQDVAFWQSEADNIRRTLKTCTRTWDGYLGIDRLIDQTAQEIRPDIKDLMGRCVYLKRQVNWRIRELTQSLRQAKYEKVSRVFTCAGCGVKELTTGWTRRDGLNQWGLRHFVTFCDECVDADMEQRKLKKEKNDACNPSGH